MSHNAISTTQAPAAIGPYSQAIKSANMVFFSGQIGLQPDTGEMISQDFEAQVHQCFKNLKAVSEAAGGNLNQIVRLGLYLTDLTQFAIANSVMAEYFAQPYPARSTIEVKGLPKGALFEVDAIMLLD